MKTMAAFTPGSMNSTTLEDALLEILRLVADRQASTANNPQGRTVITSFTQNELTGAFAVTLAIPAALSIGPTGVIANATEVFT